MKTDFGFYFTPSNFPTIALQLNLFSHKSQETQLTLAVSNILQHAWKYVNKSFKNSPQHSPEGEIQYNKVNGLFEAFLFQSFREKQKESLQNPFSSHLKCSCCFFCIFTVVVNNSKSQLLQTFCSQNIWILTQFRFCLQLNTKVVK